MVLNYGFVDHEPFSVTNYYRLKKLDYDGKVTCSNMISVTTNNEQQTINIYPNPVNDNLTCEFISGQESPAAITINDVLGNVAMQEEMKELKGINHFTLSIASLPQGIYLLRAGNRQAKFVKQ